MVTEQHVQQALRSFHCAQTFSNTHVARRLLQAFPAQPVRDTFVSAVGTAFEYSGRPDALRLRDLVMVADIEQAIPRTSAAEQARTSLRSLYRKRRIALGIIADHLNRLFERYDPSAIAMQPERPQVTIQRPRGCALFHTARSAFELHDAQGNLPAMHQDVRALTGRRHELSALERMELEIMEAALALKSGNAAAAAETLTALENRIAAFGDGKVRSLAILMHAKIAFLSGNPAEAQRLARLTIAAFPGEMTARSRAAVIVARAAVAGGEHLGRVEAPVQPFDEIYFRAVQARQRIASAGPARARAEATSLFQTSREAGLLPAAAYCAATIAMTHCFTDPIERDAWAVTALSLFASCGAAFDMSKDLFAAGALQSAQIRLTHAPREALFAIYQCLNPTSALNAIPAFHALASRLLPAIIAHAAFGSVPEETMDDLAAIAHEATLASYGSAPIASELRALCSFGEFLKVVMPAAQQAIYAQRFASSAGIIVRNLTRTLSHRRIRALSLVS